MLVTYNERPACSLNPFYLPCIIVIMNVMIWSQYSAKKKKNPQRKFAMCVLIFFQYSLLYLFQIARYVGYFTN